MPVGLEGCSAHVELKGVPLSTAAQFGRPAVCIGILAADPLRSIGLQSILEDGLHVRTVILPEGARARTQKIHVLIVDQGYDQQVSLHLPLSRALRQVPGVAIVLLTRGGGGDTTDQMTALGARAVLPENAAIAEIRACIRAVLKGKTWAPPERAGIADAAVSSEDTRPALAQRLTPKEREVMHSLAQGRSNREIAATMSIDEATVKAHLSRMLRKAEASNRVELALRGLMEGKASRKSPGMFKKLHTT